ncbi:MAG: carboxymuconolactone decarboxylase family protein [Candidatus Acetothermia bacterium]
MYEGPLEFSQRRKEQHKKVLERAGQEIKRFHNLDNQVYREGTLPKETKELLGLVASFVLRCDDCIKYHLIQCHEVGVGEDQIEEALSVGLLVGGSITIPHLRKAFQFWDQLTLTGEENTG